LKSQSHLVMVRPFPLDDSVKVTVSGMQALLDVDAEKDAAGRVQTADEAWIEIKINGVNIKSAVRNALAIFRLPLPSKSFVTSVNPFPPIDLNSCQSSPI